MVTSVRLGCNARTLLSVVFCNGQGGAWLIRLLSRGDGLVNVRRQVLMVRIFFAGENTIDDWHLTFHGPQFPYPPSPR